jgi:hypothetical protein
MFLAIRQIISDRRLMHEDDVQASAERVKFAVGS